MYTYLHAFQSYRAAAKIEIRVLEQIRSIGDSGQE